MKPIKITERNIMFSEPMSYEGDEYDLNMGLIIGKQYNYVIDTGFGSGSITPVFKYLRDNENNKPIIVVNTHWHWDHVWGNWMFPNSTIISHTKCRELIDRYWDKAVRDNEEYINGEVHKHLPNLVFEDSLYFPKDKIKLFYTPGHSLDCISIYDEVDKVLYAGDNVGDTMDNIVPSIYTDVETFKRGVIDVYKNYDFEICISGHLKPCGKEVVSLMETELENSWKNQIEKHGVPKPEWE